MSLTRLQVLRHLPHRFTADVFCKLTNSSGSFCEGCESALHLPQDLLSRWVASTASVLDLRSADLTALQWSRLFAALLQEGTHIPEIHVRAIVIPSGGTNAAAFVQSLQETIAEKMNFNASDVSSLL
jgi:hypothetical protein